MSLRVILALLVLVFFSCIAGTTVYLTKLFLETYQALLPMVTMIFIGPVPTTTFIWSLAGIVLAVVAISLILLFILVDRFFVHPIRMIARALTALGDTEETTDEMPKFSMVTKEMRDLTDSLSQFAAHVNSVHARDMEISRVKSDFISTAAHQIRTPLTAIRWALEALAKEPLNESQQQIVQNAVDKSHDLVAIIGTLLDISSIESGKYKYKFEITNAGPIAQEVATDFMDLAQKNQVVLTYEPDPNELPPVRIDSERIKWVLNNLVENAIRYTPAGGKVTVSSQAISGRIIIRVSDTGIGIPAGDRNSIFERFYRASNAIAKENQGNGLGLYIARTIATDHGGDLNFEPNPTGVGTVFSLSLPVAQTVAA